MWSRGSVDYQVLVPGTPSPKIVEGRIFLSRVSQIQPHTTKFGNWFMFGLVFVVEKKSPPNFNKSEFRLFRSETGDFSYAPLDITGQSENP